jgi:hypothetical protein
MPLQHGPGGEEGGDDPIRSVPGCASQSGAREYPISLTAHISWDSIEALVRTSDSGRTVMSTFWSVVRSFVYALVAALVAAGLIAFVTYLLRIAGLGVTTCVLILLLVVFIVYAVWVTVRLFWQLGIKQIVSRAETTIDKALRDAKVRYCWLGASSTWVVSNAKYRDRYLRPPHVTHEFGTIDPDCPEAVRAQTAWQGATGLGLDERISHTKERIAELKKEKADISWFGTCVPSFFRVTIVDDKRVFVSCYEDGKTGPDAEQLVLSRNGLLGRWFATYYKRMRSFADHHEGSGLEESSDDKQS